MSRTDSNTYVQRVTMAALSTFVLACARGDRPSDFGAAGAAAAISGDAKATAGVGASGGTRSVASASSSSATDSTGSRANASSSSATGAASSSGIASGGAGAGTWNGSPSVGGARANGGNSAEDVGAATQAGAQAMSERALIVNDRFWKDTSGTPIYSQGGGVLKVGDTSYWYGVKYGGAVTYAANPKSKNDDITFVSAH